MKIPDWKKFLGEIDWKKFLWEIFIVLIAFGFVALIFILIDTAFSSRVPMYDYIQSNEYNFSDAFSANVFVWYIPITFILTGIGVFILLLIKWELTKDRNWLDIIRDLLLIFLLVFVSQSIALYATTESYKIPPLVYSGGVASLTFPMLLVSMIAKDDNRWDNRRNNRRILKELAVVCAITAVARFPILIKSGFGGSPVSEISIYLKNIAFYFVNISVIYNIAVSTYIITIAVRKFTESFWHSVGYVGILFLFYSVGIVLCLFPFLVGVLILLLMSPFVGIACAINGTNFEAQMTSLFQMLVGSGNYSFIATIFAPLQYVGVFFKQLVVGTFSGSMESMTEFLAAMITVYIILKFRTKFLRSKFLR